MRFMKHKSFQIPKKYLRGTLCDELEMTMTNDVHHQSPEPISVQMMPEVEVLKKEKLMKEKTKEDETKPKTTQYKRDDYMNMEGVKSDILLGYNKNTYRLFLIPTLFVFNIYVYLFLAAAELILHFWAHKKNGLRTHKDVYYRSPLHILSSQYCALCRAESETEQKIFDVLNKQMRQARESQTLKHVSKAIIS